MIFWLDGAPVGSLEHVIWVWVAPLRKYVQMVGFDADGPMPGEIAYA
jgi:hypothetical protein